MEKWLGVMGYALSAAAYFFAFLLLIFTQGRTKQRTLLTIACLLSMVWSFGFAFQAYYAFTLPQWLALEALRNALWVGILFYILEPKATLLATITGNKARLLTTLLVVAFISSELLLDPTSKWYEILILLHLSQSILVLFLVEQLYRRTEQRHRWKIKPLCLGLAIIYTYDLAFFSDALLTQRVDINLLYARGWVSLVAVPLILLTARRIQQWSIRIYVSRDVVFHSTLLIVSGIYLITMAMTGYLIKYLGYSWSNIAQYIFLTLSCTILASLFLSESLRRQLKVFLVKHFYENKYDYRDEWMKFSTTLEKEDESPYHLALASMMKPFGCEQGILLEVSNSLLIQRASIDLPHIEDNVVWSHLARHAIEHEWIIDIDEMREQTSTLPFNFNELKVGHRHTIKYVVPISEDDRFQGVCLLSELKNSKRLDFEDRDLMNVISKQLLFFLSLHMSNIKLAENQQFSAFNQMSTFLVHDLKNILAQLELLSKNAHRHRNNPDFIDDAFITIESATARLNKVVSHLRKHPSQINMNEKTDICEIIVQACQERMNDVPKPSCDDNFNSPVFINSDKDRMKNVFLHLIQNSQDATDPDGWVKVSRVDKDGYFGVCIEDNGIGMSQEFIANRLFKPFDTTKGNAGMGIGAYDAKKLVEQLNGYIDVFSAEGLGSRFEVYVPIEQE
ncbi:XrtA/PEP-CTERM system histidine kinase PrsK [Vibrio alfacsensis]|uniref:XrtA/PEP-CTERM system histidine kinase PrsK n=1 Tax=Vibrio alfacsensis TaxID=1074311 RepID=UPI004068D17E